MARTVKMFLCEQRKDDECRVVYDSAMALGYPSVSAMLRAWMREAMLKLDLAGEIRLTAEERAGLFTEIRRGNPGFGRKGDGETKIA